MSNVNPKVTSAALAAAVVVVLVWVLDRFAGVVLPEAVQIAVVTLVTFAAGWLKTDTRL
jgi:hypothetical membrane protein